ncbi:hypothetical protein RRG08_049305 [Elysia crispata]|uniref:Uncharacterized protein n=1 Tax=Elysia crispata TaxID=231223 RepID=A0AAE1E951_9GAST|nr:hypothetical protein RRG08_049305 [Elysia crispata]
MVYSSAYDSYFSQPCRGNHGGQGTDCPSDMRSHKYDNRFVRSRGQVHQFVGAVNTGGTQSKHARRTGSLEWAGKTTSHVMFMTESRFRTDRGSADVMRESISAVFRLSY